MPEPFAVFLNGSYGVGKSTVLEHLGDQLAAAGTPFALMDVDWFHRSWPPADDDPRNVLAEARNIAAVWSEHRRAGPRQLLLSGVIEAPQDRERYEGATGAHGHEPAALLEQRAELTVVGGEVVHDARTAAPALSQYGAATHCSAHQTHAAHATAGGPA